MDAPIFEPVDSPFYALKSDQLAAICSSSGFQILQRYLSYEATNFCGEHNSRNQEPIWVLHRDILHGLTMPVVQLFNQASTLACAALCTEKPHDLELAFRGEARSAFLWLQCFIAEEEDWCYTRGCPACTTLHTLSTEHTIRAVLAAAQLSVPEASSPSSSEPDGESGSPSLPDFLAVLPALEVALNSDPFWEPGTYKHLLTRASRLTTGIQDLISQCSALEALVSSTPSSPNGVIEFPRRTNVHTLMPESDKDDDRAGKDIRLKKSRLAKRQLRLREEQKAMIMRMAWQCWSAVQLPAEQRMALRAVGRLGEHGTRRRTLTNP